MFVFGVDLSLFIPNGTLVPIRGQFQYVLAATMMLLLAAQYAGKRYKAHKRVVLKCPPRRLDITGERYAY